MAAMIRQLFGFTTQVKENVSKYDSTYCIIYIEILATQKMSLEPNILEDMIQIINHI